MNTPPNKKLRVVLVQPSKRQGVQSLFTFHKNEGLGHKPPLGIMSLATHLIHHGYTRTSCLDAQLDDLSPAETARQLAAIKPDLIGISVWTDFWYPAWETVRQLRRLMPDCRIVLGGPHCLVYPRETLEHSQADYIIAGDGEDTLLALADDLDAGRSPGDHPGLWRRSDHGIMTPSQPVAVIHDLDALPCPDRTLLPYHRYSNVLNPREFETTMITSRGCPYRCVFCKMHAQKVYARSAERVVQEFREIAELGITDVQVYDDTFTWSRRRVIDICQGILDAGIKVRWAVRDRVNKADENMYRLMRQAGCYRIHFGVESGSPRVLEASGKKITLPEAEAAVALANRVGFTTLAYYMFGFLDETMNDARATMRFAHKLNSDYAVFAVLIPYPDTQLYREALERNIITRDFWLEYTKHPSPDFRIPRLIEQHMSRDELIRLKDRALRHFYLRPARVMKELLRVRSLRELQHKGRMAANIVTDSADSLLHPRRRPARA